MFKLTILLILIFRGSSSIYDLSITQGINDKVIIDCNYTFDEAVKGLKIPKSITNNLDLVNVNYFSFDGKLHKGQIVVNKSVVKDIQEIFEFIKNSKFPINKIIPIVKYKWSDETSMSDNNTSAFNYRKVNGQKVLSPHADGLAIDINPMQNPHVKNNKSYPSRALYNTKELGTIRKDSQLVKEFKKRGWQWGGLWKSSKDYQHFEKP
jgi:peptidoglycan L-alanyl-D-glutamate endopeptidase CwlK